MGEVIRFPPLLSIAWMYGERSGFYEEDDKPWATRDRDEAEDLCAYLNREFPAVTFFIWGE